MSPTLPIYFLYILPGRWSNDQVLIFVLSSLGEAEFFTDFGGKYKNLGARKEILSELS